MRLCFRQRDQEPHNGDLHSVFSFRRDIDTDCCCLNRETAICCTLARSCCTPSSIILGGNTCIQMLLQSYSNMLQSSQVLVGQAPGAKSRPRAPEGIILDFFLFAQDQTDGRILCSFHAPSCNKYVDEKKGSHLSPLALTARKSHEPILSSEALTNISQHSNVCLSLHLYTLVQATKRFVSLSHCVGRSVGALGKCWRRDTRCKARYCVFESF